MVINNRIKPLIYYNFINFKNIYNLITILYSYRTPSFAYKINFEKS